MFNVQLSMLNVQVKIEKSIYFCGRNPLENLTLGIEY
jgi:hypothetical protein